MTEKKYNKTLEHMYIFHSCSLFLYILCINGICAGTFTAHPHVILALQVNTIFCENQGRSQPRIFRGAVQNPRDASNLYLNFKNKTVFLKIDYIFIENSPRK